MSGGESFKTVENQSQYNLELHVSASVSQQLKKTSTRRISTHPGYESEGEAFLSQTQSIQIYRKRTTSDRIPGNCRTKIC